MANVFLKFSLVYCIVIFFAANAFSQDTLQTTTNRLPQYRCLPCGNDCDTTIFNEPGNCPHCQMQLVNKSTVTFKTMQPSEICNYIKEHPNVVLLDVRTKTEYEGKANPDFKTLKNAINIPIQELKERLLTIDSLKDKEILVFCSRSHRSPQASYILTQNGFSKVINMTGGLSTMSDNSCKK